MIPQVFGLVGPISGVGLAGPDPFSVRHHRGGAQDRQGGRVVVVSGREGE